MPDIAMERAHLARAERDIFEGEERVFRQEELLARLQAEGRDTTDAIALLHNFRETLCVWRAHRDQILRMIDDQKG